MNKEITLLDYYQLILKKKWKVFFCVFLAIVVGVLYLVVTPKLYRSSALILLPKKAVNTSPLFMNLGIPGMDNAQSEDLQTIQLLLQSKTFAKRVVNRPDLHDVYIKDFLKLDDSEGKIKISKNDVIDSAASLFKGQLKMEEILQNSALSISTETSDKSFSPKLCSAVLDEFKLWIGEKDLTNAKRKRLAMGERLISIRRQLLEEAKELSHYYEKQRISPVESLVDVPLTLPYFSFSEPSNNDELKKNIEKKIGGLYSIKDKVENLLSQSVKDVPQQVYLRYLTQRQTILSKLDGAISQQYENVKMKEMDQELSFEIIDEPTIPKTHFSPRKRTVLGFSLIVGMMIGIFYAFIEEYIQAERKKKNVNRERD